MRGFMRARLGVGVVFLAVGIAAACNSAGTNGKILSNVAISVTPSPYPVSTPNPTLTPQLPTTTPVPTASPISPVSLNQPRLQESMVFQLVSQLRSEIAADPRAENFRNSDPAEQDRFFSCAQEDFKDQLSDDDAEGPENHCPDLVAEAERLGLDNAVFKELLERDFRENGVPDLESEVFLSPVKTVTFDN